MVYWIVTNNKEIDKNQITMNSTFEDLNMDSLDFLSIITDLEKHYHIVLTNEEVARMTNLSEAADVIEKRLAQT